MKSKVFVLLFFALLIPAVSAASFTINSTEKNTVILAESQEPARYIITIVNNGPADDFEIYSLAGVQIKPEGAISIASGETKRVEIEVYPSRKFRDSVRGYFLAEYEVFGRQSGLIKDKLQMKLLDLSQVFEVRAQNLVPGDTQTVLTIQSLENYPLEAMPAKIKSPFFEVQQDITLPSFTALNITVPLDTAKARKVVAGTYSLFVESAYKGVEARVEGAMKYLEKEGLSVNENVEGVIVRKTVIEKKNEGNIPVTASVTKKLDIISRLVTSYAESPSSISKKGFYVTYVWNKELQPSETLTVTTTTNYTLPLIILILIVGIVVLVKFYNTHSLQVQKRVHAVKTKGGEFAIKVTLHIKARSSIKDLSITDRMPHAMQLYEKFGIQPHTISHETNTLHWSLPQLAAGEERVFSYILYSKMAVVGNFELPLASARFIHNGSTETVYSNKTSVMSGIAHNE
jgi:hypothetical protein